MSESFSIEIISPDKTILKSEIKEAIIPSYEGLMGILKDHIPLITFLKPGLIIIKSKIEEKIFFIEEGIVEFANNNLLILSSTVKSLDSLDKNFLETTLTIKNSNIFFRNIEVEDDDLFINKILYMKYYYDPKELKNIVTSKNEILYMPYYFIP